MPYKSYRLDEKELRFLDNREVEGSYRPHELKDRIKKKVNLLPKRLRVLFRDLKLLEEKNYLDKEVRKEIFSEITEPDNLHELVTSSFIQQEKDLSVAICPAWWRWGKEIGFLTTLVDSMDNTEKIQTLLGLHDALFEDESAVRDSEKFQQNLEKLKKEAENLQQDFKEKTDFKSSKVISKLQSIVREIFEKSELKEEDWKEWVEFVILESYGDFDIESSTDEKIIKEKVREKIQQYQILERYRIVKKIIEDIEYLEKRPKNRKLKPKHVFEEGFSNTDESRRNKISKNLVRDEKPASRSKVEAVAEKLSEKEPPIIEIEKLKPDKNSGKNDKYKLTTYGKCLRDYLLEDIYPTDYPIGYMETPQYWKDVMDRYFSSSENESKEV